MNMRLLFLLAMTLPVAAFADGFDYNYVEAGYVSTEVDAGLVDVDGDGFGLRGSMALKDNVHIFAALDDQDLDLGMESSR